MRLGKHSRGLLSTYADTRTIESVSPNRSLKTGRAGQDVGLTTELPACWHSVLVFPIKRKEDANIATMVSILGTA